MSLLQYDTGQCPTVLPDGTDGQVLQMVNGSHTWVTPTTDCEAVNDCVGAAILAGSGLGYDDAAGSISANIATSSGVQGTGTAVDPVRLNLCSLPLVTAPAATANIVLSCDPANSAGEQVSVDDFLEASVNVQGAMQGSGSTGDPLSINLCALTVTTAPDPLAHVVMACDPLATGGTIATLPDLISAACENIQDCVGGAMAADSGLFYDDTANAYRVDLDGLPFADASLAAGANLIVGNDAVSPNGAQATREQVSNWLIDTTTTCNGLTASSNGLIAPPANHIAYADAGVINNGQVFGAVAPSTGPVTIPASITTLAITNPDPCNPAIAIFRIYYAISARILAATQTDTYGGVFVRDTTAGNQIIGGISFDFSRGMNSEMGPSLHGVATVFRQVAAAATATVTVDITVETGADGLGGSVELVGFIRQMEAVLVSGS